MNKVGRKILKAISAATGENVGEHEVIDDLQYFLRMPFKAQEKEDVYFRAICPLYFAGTGLHANNTCDALRWALRALTNLE